MSDKVRKDWLSRIEYKYYWIESLSGWLLAICMFGGFYLLFRDNQSHYGWLLLKTSFVFLFVLLFYKAFIYLYIYIDIKIKVKKGILELKDPIGDVVRDYVKKRKSR